MIGRSCGRLRSPTPEFSTSLYSSVVFTCVSYVHAHRTMKDSQKMDDRVSVRALALADPKLPLSFALRYCGACALPCRACFLCVLFAF